MEQDTVDQVADLVTKRLEEVTEGGRKTSPNMSTLLDDLENSESKGVVGDPYDIQNFKIKEIQRLKVLYADLEPICKWQEENVNSAENQDTDDDIDEAAIQEKDVPPGRRFGASIRRVLRSDRVASGGITADDRQSSIRAII
jgi:hypothetical protein